MDQEDSTVWHEAASVLPKLTDSSVAATDEVVQVKTSVAQKLIEVEAERYQKKLSRTNASDAQWLRTVSSGVLSGEEVLCDTHHYESVWQNKRSTTLTIAEFTCRFENQEQHGIRLRPMHFWLSKVQCTM